MAQITLNTKLNSEEFTLNDNDILYLYPLVVGGSTVGSVLTIIDTASVDTNVVEVEELVADVTALTDNLVQITLEDRSTPYIAISRIKDIITVGDYAQIRYDGNGNVFQVLKTNMTIAQILAAINTEQNQPKEYVALLTQSGTSAPDAVILKNTLGGEISWSYTGTGRYTGTLASAFPQLKTAITMGNTVGYSIACERINDNSVEVFVDTSSSDTASNDILVYTVVNILVYP